MKRRSKAVALAPPPLASRKRARQITTLFHRYEKARDEALANQNEERAAEMEQRIEQIGGRTAYQRASQVSTSFFSTSKWVLGVLARNGWLYGIKTRQTAQSATAGAPRAKQLLTTRRPVRLLEVGAINTELLDAAAKCQTTVTDNTTGNSLSTKYRLEVRAIDLHSMHPQIEEMDFLAMPLIGPGNGDHCRYDVIVCSMVLNCVTTPAQRGTMIARLYHFLRPGGLCFITIPKSCLTSSKWMNREAFTQLLLDVGLPLRETKDSPRISFFLCNKAEQEQRGVSFPPMLTRWEHPCVIHREGRRKKYRTDFAVTLTERDRDILIE